MSLPTQTHEEVDEVRQHLLALVAAAREMTPAGAKPIPAVPERVNLLARYPDGSCGSCCYVCGLPGHDSYSIKKSSACRIAMISVIGFWEDMAAHISFLRQHSERFREAVVANEPTYEMRLGKGPVKAGNMETVLVDSLTKNWLKFQSVLQRTRPKVHVLLEEDELARLNNLAPKLNGSLLNGLTLTDLFEQSLAEQQ